MAREKVVFFLQIAKTTSKVRMKVVIITPQTLNCKNRALKIEPQMIETNKFGGQISTTIVSFKVQFNTYISLMAQFLQWKDVVFSIFFSFFGMSLSLFLIKFNTYI